MRIKGTRTEQNLLKAFAGESQARNRYTFFASAGQEGGLRADLARSSSRPPTTRRSTRRSSSSTSRAATPRSPRRYPAGGIGTTAENLLAAAEGEKMEWGTLYPDFAAVADEEGFADVADVVPRDRRGRGASRGALPQAARERRGRARSSSATAAVRWKCRNCGYVHEGPEAPAVCPACKHPQAYYELFSRRTDRRPRHTAWEDAPGTSHPQE